MRKQITVTKINIDSLNKLIDLGYEVVLTQTSKPQHVAKALGPSFPKLAPIETKIDKPVIKLNLSKVPYARLS
jgi:hypothetical protein